jgi:hypothetical protein
VSLPQADTSIVSSAKCEQYPLASEEVIELTKILTWPYLLCLLGGRAA